MEEQAEEEAGEIVDYLFQVKSEALKNSESINAMNTKLNVVEKLTNTVASQQQTIKALQETVTRLQEATIAKLSGVDTSGGGGGRGGGGRGGRGGRGAGRGATRKKCKNCGKWGSHEPDDCLELPKNEAKRESGWKSVFDGMVNPHYYPKA